MLTNINRESSGSQTKKESTMNTRQLLHADTTAAVKLWEVNNDYARMFVVIRNADFVGKGFNTYGEAMEQYDKIVHGEA